MKQNLVRLFSPGILFVVGLSGCGRGIPAQPQNQTLRTVSLSAPASAASFCEYKCQAPVSFSATGVVNGDQLVATGQDGSKFSTSITNVAAPFSPAIPIGGSGVTPGLIKLQIVPANGTPSNTITVKILSAQKLVAQNHATGNVYLLVPGENSTVKEFQSDGTTLTQSFATGIPDPYSIAVDDLTGYVLVSHGGSPSVSAFDPKQKGAAVSGNFGSVDAIGLAAAGGNACAALANSSGLACLPHLGGGSTALFGPAGIAPSAIAMEINGSGDTRAFAYDAGNATLEKFALPGMAFSSVQLPFAPAGAPAPYPVAVITNDFFTTAGITVAVTGLSPDKKPVVVLTDGATLTHGEAPLPGIPYLLAADPAHQGFVAGYWDDAANETRFISISNAMGPVPLTATASSIPVGLEVSTDGSKLYLGGGTTPTVLENK